jgi:hypothetical protein
MKAQRRHFTMKFSSFFRCAMALGLVSVTSTSYASSHREAPAISNDPAADNTDLWAWAPPTHDKLIVVASYIPLEEPSGGPNYNKFSDDVLYEIHIAKGKTSLADAVTYQIRFSSAPIAHVDPAAHGPAGGGKEFYAQIAGYYDQTYTVTKIVAGQAPVVVASGVDVAPPNIGPRTTAAWSVFKIYPKASGAGTLGATPTYDDAFASSFTKTTASEGKFWAGPRDDGFYVDLGRTFDLASFANPSFPGYNASSKDNVAGYNCHTIAMEIPASVILGHSPGVANDGDDTVGVWASASRRKVRVLRNDGTEDGSGPWVQVSRLGFPLVNEAVVGIQDKDKYNRTTPETDLANIGPYILNPVVAIDALTVGAIDQATADVSDGKTAPRADIVDILNIKDVPTAGAHAITSVGDVLRVDMGRDPGFPNGRPLPSSGNTETPVTDIELSLLILGPGKLSGIAQGATHNDKNYGPFPYLALPWEGSREGHGK